jgi:hypothetical protein
VKQLSREGRVHKSKAAAFTHIGAPAHESAMGGLALIFLETCNILGT